MINVCTIKQNMRQFIPGLNNHYHSENIGHSVTLNTVE